MVKIIHYKITTLFLFLNFVSTKLNIFRETNIYLDRQLVARVVDKTESLSKTSAYKKAMVLLEQHHYQIIINKDDTTSIRQFLINLNDALENEKTGSKAKTICANDANKDANSVESVQPSVALKMMKLMGWKGSGLGAKEQGIQEPVEYVLIIELI